MTSLTSLGWNEFFALAYAALGQENLLIGRVAGEDKHRYTLYAEAGEVLADASGKLLYGASSQADLPKVGDWVVFSPVAGDERAVIHHVLPRRSVFARKQAGRGVEEQVLATNLDVLFIVQGLDANFNLRRLERYLAMAYDGQVTPVVVLNKTDLCDDVAARVAEVQAVAPNVHVLAVSAVGGETADVAAFIRPGVTVAVVGSSGVGKSTLINNLVGEERQETAEISRKRARGRHTTTRRELILLPQGGILIDTPGLRELQVLVSDDGLNETFSDIEELAARCRFSDCTHTREPGCAVLAAVQRGDLAAERHANYLALQREMATLEQRLSQGREAEWKRIAIARKQMKKYR